MPTEAERERLKAILPAFEGIEADDLVLPSDLARQAEAPGGGTVFAVELASLEAIAARINELSEIVRQNALVAED